MPSWLLSLKENFKNFLKKIYLFRNTWQKTLSSIFGIAKNNFQKQDDLDQKIISQVSPKKMPTLKQLKYLPEILTPPERKKIKFLSYILILSLVILLITSYFNLALVPRNGGSYTEGIVGAPKFINPLYSSINSTDKDIVQLIFSGLVRIDNNLNIVPDLAETWFISDDQKIYTFKLKENLTWHDGEPLTIYDVLFTFEAIQNPEYKSPLATSFENVEIKQVDEQTLQFILSEPYAPFLENLTVGILPEHIWLEVVPANTLLADYNLKPIGSGPFTFKSLTKDKLGNIKSYKLIKNKNYHEHVPYLNDITFKFYPDYKSAVMALKNHNIDGLNYLPKELQTDLSTRKDIAYHSLQLPHYTALFFNDKKNTLLKNVKFKTALAQALNKNEIIANALNGNGESIDAPILPGFIGYNPKIAKYDFNLDQANQILDELGYLKSDDSQFRSKDGNELSITLTAVNAGENFLSAQLLQKMWQAVGIKTELNLIDASRIKTDIIKNRDFEILLFGEIVGLDPDPYPFWHSSQAGEAGLNLANFINREADKVLEEARKISDPQKRHDKYIHFQNILNQHLPAIFLYTPKYLYPITQDIKGLETNKISTPTDRFSNITHWFIKTKRNIF